MQLQQIVGMMIPKDLQQQWFIIYISTRLNNVQCLGIFDRRISETGSISTIRWKVGKDTAQFGPLEKNGPVIKTSSM
jgi:hypothetical protein